MVQVVYAARGDDGRWKMYMAATGLAVPTPDGWSEAMDELVPVYGHGPENLMHAAMAAMDRVEGRSQQTDAHRRARDLVGKLEDFAHTAVARGRTYTPLTVFDHLFDHFHADPDLFDAMRSMGDEYATYAAYYTAYDTAFAAARGGRPPYGVARTTDDDDDDRFRDFKAEMRDADDDEIETMMRKVGESAPDAVLRYTLRIITDGSDFWYGLEHLFVGAIENGRDALFEEMYEPEVHDFVDLAVVLWELALWRTAPTSPETIRILSLRAPNVVMGMFRTGDVAGCVYVLRTYSWMIGADGRVSYDLYDQVVGYVQETFHTTGAVPPYSGTIVYHILQRQTVHQDDLKILADWVVAERIGELVAAVDANGETVLVYEALGISQAVLLADRNAHRAILLDPAYNGRYAAWVAALDVVAGAEP